MKRPYKIGDWFRIPLGGEHDALGIITHACRSRLFGYFFAIDAAHTPAFDELKTLRAGDAAACALFGGAGLEEARWSVVATSLPFDSSRWPFPQFASRGVFGRTWMRVTYDPGTMSVLQREPLAAEKAVELPDARFATPEELESFLRSEIAGETPETPLAVCEVRAPVTDAALQLVARGGRIQFSEPFAEADIARLAEFANAHPAVELRVHGLLQFDLRQLEQFTQLRSLVLDVASIRYAGALATLRALESLRVGAMQEALQLDAIVELPALHRLELRGANADVRTAARVAHLDSLALIDTPEIEVQKFAAAARLKSLLIAHTSFDVSGIARLPALERLELRDMPIVELPDFSGNPQLRAIEFRNVTLLRDLAPLSSAPALRDLRIEGMPQFGVSDFKPLLACAALRHVNLDIGSKTKSREVYRMLRERATAS